MIDASKEMLWVARQLEATWKETTFVPGFQNRFGTVKVTWFCFALAVWGARVA
ncbi:hypothetical protein [Microbacterium sp. NIBRBAC000506063]|uniref:hypothetical protein n=1 Tax=Microbacterium sp. NIBRBAC000506063 TaxID=2734618 RepID=UPI001BB56A89|nr:hypothetical protein [Microbacterium sp. NIBRBAC000506063]QTV80202.1 hypothetical protein KAE78_03960 [Microbacterium sp. NIBRBAC000506063]